VAEGGEGEAVMMIAVPQALGADPEIGIGGVDFEGEGAADLVAAGLEDAGDMTTGMDQTPETDFSQDAPTLDPGRDPTQDPDPPPAPAPTRLDQDHEATPPEPVDPDHTAGLEADPAIVTEAKSLGLPERAHLLLGREEPRQPAHASLLPPRKPQLWPGQLLSWLSCPTRSPAPPRLLNRPNSY